GVGRVDSRAFSLCNKGYYGTGDGSGSNLNDFWQYEPVTDKWTRKADVPGPSHGRDEDAAFAIGNKGYFGLGSDWGLYRDFYEYAPDSPCVLVPLVSFESSDTIFCNEPIKCINFYDRSTECNPTSWKWTFVGGVPASSTQQN